MEPKAVERRLSAILSADVFGYSRLMADDEEATVRALNLARAEVSRLVAVHHGRVVDFRGDDFLCEFPSALDAVRAASELQSALAAQSHGVPEARRMQFRMGVHLGDVMVEGERIYGDGVNISARLEAIAEPGGICISGPVHEQVRHKLDVGFEDLGPRTVKNLPDPVHVWRVLAPGAAAPARPRGAPVLRRRAIAVVVFLAVAAAGAVFVWPLVPGLVLDAFALQEPLANPPLPDRPSIVLLPFANLSDDAEQEYFADGMTEDMITDLSRINEIFVISRSSAFTYKDRSVKIEDVGRELGVRYVLEGSVRKLGDRIRINAQLIDATTGFHVWAERYDEPLADLFEVQRRISERILAALQVEILQAEAERLARRPTDDLTAYQLYLQALGVGMRGSRDAYAQQRPLLERALELDPDFAQAHAVLAQNHAASYLFLYTLEEEALDTAAYHAQRATELEPDLPDSHLALAMVYYARGDGPAALRESEIAAELAPNDVGVAAWRGVALIDYGNPIAGLQWFSHAVRLSPRGVPTLWAGLGYAYMQAGRADEATELFERSRRADPNLILPRLGLMSLYLGSGQGEEARRVVDEILEINPDLTAERLSKSYVYGRDGLEAQLREAGMP
ncbi:MAG: tetratricopeptide repeat protein [Deltaproteobacteria bacterium]|nr:tetratricopeptide repeat protein [Deltaproteobacteria bacterium]MBW2413312.1 tetratricopeptide repeat protein [Deltaproteobacteria bacterium]